MGAQTYKQQHIQHVQQTHHNTTPAYTTTSDTYTTTTTRVKHGYTNDIHTMLSMRNTTNAYTNMLRTPQTMPHV
eukprot:5562397-Heterocapsa_arctica.AAC.1